MPGLADVPPPPSRGQALAVVLESGDVVGGSGSAGLGLWQQCGLDRAADLGVGPLPPAGQRRPRDMPGQGRLLFDDLVGATEDRQRDRQPERIGGLQVDH